MKNLPLALWLAAWAVLLFTFTVAIQERDSDVVLYFGMMALTFPSGLLAVWLIRALDTLGLSLPNGVLGQYIGLTLFILVGYCQWFVLLPKFFRFFKSRPTRRSSGTAQKRAAP
jgi:hypothetical protein